LLCLKLRYG